MGLKGQSLGCGRFWLGEVLFLGLIIDVGIDYVLVLVVIVDEVFIDVVFQFLNLLFKGVIAGWWKGSFANEAVAVNGEVVHSLGGRQRLAPTFTAPIEYKSRSLHNRTFITFYILVFAMSFCSHFFLYKLLVN
jgi:hypothetical protein